MAHDTRFKNGLALGPYNNFFARSDNVFSNGDTTPDVTDGVLFYTANTATTSITNFDLTSVGGGAGSNAGDFEGKLITIVMIDGSTSIANSPRILTANSSSIGAQDAVLDFVYHNSSWIQRGGSLNQSSFISVDSNSIKSGQAMYPNASTGNIIVTGLGPSITLNLLHGSTAAWALRRVIGALPGTQLNLICGGDSQALVIVNSAAADTFVCQSSGSSTQFRLVTSAAITFVKGLNKWYETAPVWVATNGTLST